jgi:hypothetical protein
VHRRRRRRRGRQIPDWLAETLPAGARVGIDPFCHTVDAVRSLSSKLQARGPVVGGRGRGKVGRVGLGGAAAPRSRSALPTKRRLIEPVAPRGPPPPPPRRLTRARPPQARPCQRHSRQPKTPQARGKELVPLLADGNLVDAAWGDAQPPLPLALLRVHPLRWAGQGVADKLAAMRARIKGAGPRAGPGPRGIGRSGRWGPRRRRAGAPAGRSASAGLWHHVTRPAPAPASPAAARRRRPRQAPRRARCW